MSFIPITKKEPYVSQASNSVGVPRQDPGRNIFSHLTPIVYASSPAQFYEEDSAGTVHYLDMLCGGLRDKRVLDLGCGYGTTTMQLSRFAPAEIVAVDPSADMLELMSRVHGEEETDFRVWLEERGARPVLGNRFDLTIAKLEHRRCEFSHGIFRRRGGKLVLRQESAFDLDPAKLGLFDAVAANNVLHWAINQRREELRKENPTGDEKAIHVQAVTETFGTVVRMLKPGGSAVLMEPKNFISIDDDPAFEADGEVYTINVHPLFERCNIMLNALLQQRYGIERSVPKNTPLLPRSRIKEWCAAVGLDVTGVLHREIAAAGDVIATIIATMPMQLGQVDITHDEKLDLTNEVVGEMERMVSTKERLMPIFVQSFFICCRKVQ